MNDTTASTGLKAQLAPLQARWQALGENERGALSLLAWVLGLALVWMIAVQPALRTLKATPPQLEALDLQLQQMQALATEARELRGAAPVPAAQALEALQAASSHLGEGAKLTINGDRAVLNVTGIASDKLQGWLGEVRSAARARPIEARLQRTPQGGYSGSIVLALSGAPS